MKAYENEIEDAYHKSGNKMGWRLLASPESTLRDAKVAFIGLNPGGSSVDVEQSVYAMPEGKSAYVTESWAGHAPGKNPLQSQVRSLFSRLEVSPDAVLAGNLVPFRSPSWKDLKDHQGSLAFGKELWGKILRQAKPSILITMGGDTTKAAMDIMGVQKMNRYSVGWGDVSAQRGEFDGGTLIGLPHLSRFGIMRREASKIHLGILFENL